MGLPTAGEVVSVPFPFSDLSQSKVRPAVCLADAGRGDAIFCQVTSQPYGDPLAIPIESTDFASGGLRITSYVRPGKLFTADAKLIVGNSGRLSAAMLERIRTTVINLLRVGHS